MSNNFFEEGLGYPVDRVGRYVDDWDEDEMIEHIEGTCSRDCYWCCNEPED